MGNPLNGELLSQMYERDLMRMLTEDLWLSNYSNYKFTDKRSRLKKLTDLMYWKTVGRFKSWLHRDCNGDW